MLHPFTKFQNIPLFTKTVTDILMFSQLRRTKVFSFIFAKTKCISPLFRYLPDPYPQHTGTRAHTRTHTTRFVIPMTSLGESSWKGL